jgi:cleavage stimulation factor subunit 2
MASAAVRNLNDHEINNRKLRVDFSHEGAASDHAPAGYVPQPPPPMNLPTNGSNNMMGGFPPGPPPPQPGSVLLPPLPQGVEVPEGLTTPDAISRTLRTLPPQQLLDILQQMKALVMSEPAKAAELLQQAPQLSYAIFQALLLMDLCDPNVLTKVIEQQTNPNPVPQPTPQPQMPPQGFAPPQHGYPPFPPGGPPSVPTPPQRYGQQVPPPPQQVQRAPAPAVPQSSDPQALMQFVLGLTEEQLQSYGEAEQAGLRAIRAQHGIR